MFCRRIRIYLKFLKSVLKANIGLLVGMWKLTKLPQPTITIFGSARLPLNDRHSKIIIEIAEKLTANGFSILTGGGQGIMDAANLGAINHINGNKNTNHKKISFGVGVIKLGKNNHHLQRLIIMPYFFTRKWLLVRYSTGFIVGPGGFGTMDELSEILTLIQTHHMKKLPIVLIGKDFWQPIIDWINNKALKSGVISQQDTELISAVTDDPDEAVNIIKNYRLSFTEFAAGLYAKPKKDDLC